MAEDQPGASGEPEGTEPFPAPPAPPAQPRGRRRGRLIAIVAAALVVLGGAAFAAVVIFNRIAGTGDVLVRMVPADADVYVAAYFDPGAGQKVNLIRLGDKFPAIAHKQLGPEIDRLLDQALASSGLSFTRDIKPWLGTQFSLAARIQGAGQPGAVALISSKDDAAARSTLTRAESRVLGQGLLWSGAQHAGVTVNIGRDSAADIRAAWAITDHTVLLSNDPTLIDAVIDTAQGHRANLGDDDRYRRTLDGLPKSVLGVLYVNPSALASSFSGIASGSGTGVQSVSAPSSGNPLDALQGIGVSLSAQPAGLSLDFAVAFDPSKLPALAVPATHNNAVLSFVPERAYGVLGVEGLRQGLQTVLKNALDTPDGRKALRQFDLNTVVGHLTGDAGLELEPGPTQFPAGALLVGTDDEAGMRKFLDQVAQSALQGNSGVSVEHQTYKGVAITFVPVAQLQRFGVEPAYAVTDGMGIVASSPDELKAVIDAHGGANITESPTFRDVSAQVSGSRGDLLYFDVQAIAGALRAVLPPDAQARFDSDVEPNLRPVKALMLTGESGSGIAKAHMFVLIR